MTDLQVWLKRVTCGLSQEAKNQVHHEIEDHYLSARDAALAQGAAPDQADRQALAALGDADTANIRYRSVLLTREEAKMLRGVKRDGEFFRCRPALGRAFRLGPACYFASRRPPTQWMPPTWHGSCLPQRLDWA